MVRDLGYGTTMGLAAEKQHGGTSTNADQAPKVYTLVKGYDGNLNSSIWVMELASSTNSATRPYPRVLLIR